MKRKRKTTRFNRPRLPTGSNGGKRRQAKVELQMMTLGKETLFYDADVSAAGAGRNRRAKP